MLFEKMSEKYTGLLRDESRLEGHAEAVARPGDINELALAVREAAKSGKQLTVQGSATGVAGGGVPQGGLLISTRNMNRILGLREEGGQFFLRAEAGVTLGQVEDYLRRPVPLEGFDENSAAASEQLKNTRPRFFPPNPSEKSASIGGAFACGAHGINSFRYRHFSHWVSALSWVMPGGDIWNIRRGDMIYGKTGYRLPDGSSVSPLFWDNNPIIYAQLPNSSLDLIDFLEGSEGRLGIAGELELALLPVPKVIWGLFFFFAAPGGAKLFTKSLPDNDLLAGYEYFDAAVLGLLRESREINTSLKRLPELPGDALEAVYIELSGEDEAVAEEYLSELLGLFLESGGKDEDAWAADSQNETEKFRALRHAAHELVNAEIDKARLTLPGLIKYDLDFMSVRLWDIMNSCRREAAKHGFGVFCYGNVFKSQLHINFIPKTAKQKAVCEALFEKWAKQITESGSYIALENGVGKNKRELMRKLMPPEWLEYYAGLQKLFDPGNIMQNQL